MTKEIIELQSAHFTQLTDKGIKGDWSVQENITHKKLHSLPSTISDKDMFAVMDFVKIFELRALNVGIQHAKALNNQPLKDTILHLKSELDAVHKHNEKLAQQLHQLLTNEET